MALSLVATGAATGEPAGLLAAPRHVAAAPATAAEREEKYQHALRGDARFQVRVQAAAALGKLGDRDAVPVLVQAMMEDKHELVRAASAEALGKLGDANGAPALQAARSDPSSTVRAHAELALHALSAAGAAAHQPAAASPEDNDSDPGAAGSKAARRIPVTLGRMGSKARGLTPDLPKRLREAIAKELRGTPDVQVLDEGQGQDHRQTGFTVESSVTEMSRRTIGGGQMEVTCEVSMVIGILPSRAIVGMTSGGATIQAPLAARLSKAAAESLEADALTHAVRGAHQNLVAFLRNQK